MKNYSKIILAGFIVFVLATILATGCYFILHLSQEFQFDNLMKILTQVGLLSGTVTLLTYVLLNISLRKIKDTGFRSFVVVALIFFYLAFVGLLILNMIFYQLDNPYPFIKYLIEI
ncbi:hypothetical protein VUJ46_09175 [Chryseobacterium sp. MYb264]|uniref:hypothetical protein n=1 Tax=Chryseobacterium sp. MYb264 TaxID=2745153 RepID=UPI002E15F920|nr:hypothetical protein VUJ46_09175 [Chryseobacterium sp. MYb264]